MTLPRVGRRRPSPAFAAAIGLALHVGCASPDTPPPPAPPTEATAESMLLALGYVDGALPPDGAAGVRVRVPEAMQPGTNLVASGDDWVVREIDDQGVEVRRWELPHSARRETDTPGFRDVEPLADGGVLAVIDGRALVRFRSDGTLAWRVDDHAHHVAHVLPGGGFVGLTRDVRADIRFPGAPGIIDDYVTWFDDAGVTTRRISVLDALRQSPWSDLLDHGVRSAGEVLHTNAVDVVTPDRARPEVGLAAGTVLLTSNYLSAVFAIAPDSGRITWMLSGKEFRRPHDAFLQPDGRVRVFDNQGAWPWSAVRWYDTDTLEQTEAFVGSPAVPFATEHCGSVSALPNGNLLLVDTMPGRAFEVSPDRAVVWRWDNPARAPGDPALVASLFDLVRVPGREAH